MTTRRYSFLDRLLIAADEGVRTLAGTSPASRAVPSADGDGDDPRLSAALMRVNHTGEVCAQALYSGQTLFARDASVGKALRHAASEERDHLAWCRERLRELDSRPSVLDPVWYVGSFGLGVISGLAGDRWSMGFLTETEAQVERHLEGHLRSLPSGDLRSRAIVEQMRDDEARHGQTGVSLGARELPLAVRAAMRLASRLMTRTARYV